MLRLAVYDKILQVFAELFPDLHIVNCNETEDKKFLSFLVVKKF